MRTSPLVGERAWFGPRRWGWGLSPVSTEGWVATVVAMTLSTAARRRWPERPWLRHAPMIALVTLAVVKGTAPGGASARAAWRASTDHHPPAAGQLG